MRSYLFLSFLIISITSFGQPNLNKDSLRKADSSISETKSVDCNPMYDSVTQRDIFFVTYPMPEFPGGMDLLFKYIANNLKYPPITREGSIQGRVYIRFIVEPNGKITNIKVLRGIDPYLDKLAIEFVQNMPDWIPGQCDGMKVPAYFTIPITFQLN